MPPPDWAKKDSPHPSLFYILVFLGYFRPEKIRKTDFFML